MKLKLPIFLMLSLTLFVSCSSNQVEHEIEREPASFQSCLEAMNNIINYKVYTGAADNSFLNAKSLEELEANYGGESLLEIQYRLSDEEIKSNNSHLQKLLIRPLEIVPIAGKKSSLTTAEADVLYKAMENSKIHKNHDSYDPQGTIGFCFGRATIAHMEAIVRNVHPEAIRKIWIAGDMEKWGHHVATMVKTDVGWMVLDTNIGRAITSEEWIKKYRPYKAKDAKEIMVFVTQAGRFSPQNTASYNAIDLFNTNSLNFNKVNDFYRGYFQEYFEDLDNVSRPPLFSN